MLIASARTWTAAELTPALSSSNSASGAHSAVANVLLTPFRPPQVTELISVTRTGEQLGDPVEIGGGFRERWAEQRNPTVDTSQRFSVGAERFGVAARGQPLGEGGGAFAAAGGLPPRGRTVYIRFVADLEPDDAFRG